VRAVIWITVKQGVAYKQPYHQDTIHYYKQGRRKSEATFVIISENVDFEKVEGALSKPDYKEHQNPFPHRYSTAQGVIVQVYRQ
jgi:hypothetical protein